MNTLIKFRVVSKSEKNPIILRPPQPPPPLLFDFWSFRIYMCVLVRLRDTPTINVAGTDKCRYTDWKTARAISLSLHRARSSYIWGIYSSELKKKKKKELNVSFIFRSRDWNTVFGHSRALIFEFSTFYRIFFVLHQKCWSCICSRLDNISKKKNK